ncbi:putative membrane protein (TIGR02226 family) [Pseudoduganella flava]|uniref:Putative membrane protein (TIGR02226 family) n=1 Tax=Pseudoduganella flava TaxID=871742 RepID=A0A562P8I1_9BURK|nr:hypothetical protein [Pseudoduganella flava]QGZ40779.1 hypothetical protein GO485_18050 [Pseudoduganella flava]TWI40752.1 putative membrane protein (TIGR02226 family) [Pseudoduganella flava]
MTSLQPLWWLALPVLLLPILWHRQKRQRSASELLATARFLPSTAPQLRRVWRWTDLLLLALRLLLLVALIARLAVTIVPWRGDTVLADPALDPAWVAQQVRSAGMESAARIDLPADPLAWIPRHEHEFRRGTRLLVLGRAGTLTMPAVPPAFLHAVDLRSGPPALVPERPALHRVVVASVPERAAQWRALFAAFGSTGARWSVVEVPDDATELVVWDRDGTPPAEWKAPHWWQAARAPGARQVTAAGLALSYADTPRGRFWSGLPWPPASEAQAHAVYEAWRQVAVPPQPYPLAALTVAATRATPLPLPGKEPAHWLGWALLILFALERLVSHARRT